MTNGPRIWVEVLEMERIVERGTQRTQWFVRHNDGWILARHVPSAECDQLSPTPGTVWQVCIRLELALGAALMRVETEPAPRRARDTFGHLTRAARGPERTVRRIHYRVASGGELERIRNA